MSAGPSDKTLDAFKSLIFDGLLEQAIASIIAIAPWLSFPPLAFTIGVTVRFVGNKIYEILRDVVNFEVVMLRNDLLHREFVKAVRDVRVVILAKGIDSPEFRKARDAHKAALAKLVRYGT